MERIAPRCECKTDGPLARGLCMSCYGKAYRAGALPPVQDMLPFNPPHRLSEVDEEQCRAVCEVCGPVDIRVRTGGGRGRYECMTYRRISRRTPQKRRTQKRRTTGRSQAFDHVKWKYGISREEWDAKLIGQAGRCAMCGDCMTNPYVDHCHRTGNVRDLLCHRCNTALGWLNDEPVRAEAAARYLTRHQAT